MAADNTIRRYVHMTEYNVQRRTAVDVTMDELRQAVSQSLSEIMRNAYKDGVKSFGSYGNGPGTIPSAYNNMQPVKVFLDEAEKAGYSVGKARELVNVIEYANKRGWDNKVCKTTITPDIHYAMSNAFDEEKAHLCDISMRANSMHKNVCPLSASRLDAMKKAYILAADKLMSIDNDARRKLIKQTKTELTKDYKTIKRAKVNTLADSSNLSEFLEAAGNIQDAYLTVLSQTNDKDLAPLTALVQETAGYETTAHNGFYKSITDRINACHQDIIAERAIPPMNPHAPHFLSERRTREFMDMIDEALDVIPAVPATPEEIAMDAAADLAIEIAEKLPENAKEKDYVPAEGALYAGAANDRYQMQYELDEMRTCLNNDPAIPADMKNLYLPRLDECRKAIEAAPRRFLNTEHTQMIDVPEPVPVDVSTPEKTVAKTKNSIER